MPPVTPTRWHNIFGPSDAAAFNLDVSGAYSYEVYDIWHGLVASGTSAGGATLTIPAPGQGWALGHYRVYLPSLNYSSAFVVLNESDTRFSAKPTTVSNVYAATGNFTIGDYDPAIRGVFGIGPERIGLRDQTTYQTELAVANEQAKWWHDPAVADPARPRPRLVAFAEQSPDPTADYLLLHDSGGTGFGNESMLVFCANPAADGSAIFVAITAGTSSGFKVTVSTPNAATVVETFDNLASPDAAQAAINATSTRIRVFSQHRGGNPAPMAATAIGNAARLRVAACARDFAAAGIDNFEGPWNEPQDADPAQIAHHFAIWAASVKSGAPSAKTIGPGPVSYTVPFQNWLRNFLAAVDRTNLDGITVHAYNTHNGDVRLTRQCLADLQQILTDQGLATLPRWQTEQGWQWPWYGANRSRGAVAYYSLLLLLMEQYGIPLERNYYWYDVDNAYWPMTLILGNLSQAVHPMAPAFRTLTGERFGKNYTGPLNFGTPGNDLYVGNTYTAADGSRSLALLNCGEGDGGQLTFSVTGAATLVRLDCYGNATTVAVTGGKATVAVDNTPTYLRVPAGATCTPDQLNFGADLASGATVAASGGTQGAFAPASRITTPGLWNTYYQNSEINAAINLPNPWMSGSVTFPQTVTVTLGAPKTANMVVLRTAPTWQKYTTLLDFDVQISGDGTSWSTVYTYTKNPTAKYVQRLTSDGSMQSKVEQWDDERLAWRVPFTSTTVAAVRLVVRNCTCGGAIDSTVAGLMIQGNTAGPGTTYPIVSSLQLYSTAVAPAGNPYVVRTIT